MARPLLLMLPMAGFAAACVIPPPGDFAEGDAGPSSAPVLLSAAPPEFAFPGSGLNNGVISVNQGDQRRLALSLRDQDLDDTLFVRLYVDYGRPDRGNAAADCIAVPSGEQLRVADCSTASLCNLIDDTDLHFLEAMVSDLDFLSDSDPLAAGQPPFRAVPPTAAFSFRSWLMTCSP